VFFGECSNFTTVPQFSKELKLSLENQEFRVFRELRLLKPTTKRYFISYTLKIVTPPYAHLLINMKIAQKQGCTNRYSFRKDERNHVAVPASTQGGNYAQKLESLVLRAQPG
jgi:hypothetical protein